MVSTSSNLCRVQILDKDFVITIPKNLTRILCLRNGETILFDKTRNGIHVMRNDSWCG